MTTAVDRERRLREALENLVNKLTEIHGNSEYQSVWIMSQMHNGPYVGPSYEGELNAAKAALADQPPPDPREAALDAAEKALVLLLPWALQAGANAEDAIGLICAARGKA
jgi:hypothetical protein